MAAPELGVARMNYSPRRDFIGALLACLGMIAVIAIGTAMAASIMEGLPA
jgi:hypothetical protein